MLAFKCCRAGLGKSSFYRRELSSISFNAFGNPSQVLKVGDFVPVQSPKNDQAVIALQSSPVTYEDIRAIHGLSFLRSDVGVGGTFGVGKVRSIGEGVTTAAVDSLVLFSAESGVWNDETLVNTNCVYDVSSLSADKAALVPDVASAWAIVNNFTTLGSGDVVARSTGGSATFNQTVDALCKEKGCTVIVASDAELLDQSFKKKVEGKGLKLAISHHAGKHAKGLSHALCDGGVLVTHNAAIPSIRDCDGVEAPVAKLIFNNIRVCGFDFAAMAREDRAACSEAVSAAVSLLGGTMQVDAKSFSSTNFTEAFERASRGQASILTFSK